VQFLHIFTNFDVFYLEKDRHDADIPSN
jgi:hypothetical protein